MGFWNLLATVVPLGIGAAFTPSLLAMQILIVSRDPWRQRSLAVIVGAASAFVLVGLLFLLGFTQLPRMSEDGVGAVIRIVVGVGLWGFCIWLFIPHPQVQARVEADIQRYVGRATPWLFFGIAFALSIKDVSSFVVLIPAIHDIAVGDVNILEQVILLVVLYVLALSPVLLPPALRMAFGHRVDRPFQVIYRFTMDHQFAIVGVMCAIIGFYLVVSGWIMVVRSG